MKPMTPWLAVALLVPAVAAAQAPAAREPEIATSGEGEVTLQPDHVHLSLGVELKAATGSAASAQVGARAQQVRQAIRAKGFPLDSIRVTGFDVSPNFDFQRERRLVDYRGAATIELTIRPLDRVGPVIDTALV